MASDPILPGTEDRSMTSLSILWHFHQPDYRDPTTGRPVLPWVRHHALRGYRDLAMAIVESGVAQTVNLVPTLIEQVAGYAGGGTDDWLDRVVCPAEALDPQARAGLTREGFSGHPAMVDAAPGWAALRHLVGRGEGLSVQALRDLQVWSVLGWTGWSARRDHPRLADLVAQGRDFTEADKQDLLRIQAAICAELPDLWRRLPEVSASPWGHPILPLLVDANHGRRCLPDLPHVPFAWPQDAAAQLARGKADVEALLGRPVDGLWPSEGAVSPEVVSLAAQAGFTWLATDEGVLHRSERQGRGRGPWTLAPGLVGFFRDHDLSDHIGFRTAGRDPATAVDALLQGLRGQQGHVTLALDGENPWESHADAGQGFLVRLLDRLAADRALAPVGFAEASARPVGTISRIFTGGWINADFAIWIGDAEDRAAWALLAETRDAVAQAGDPPGALAHVHAAEGSDWFWWYGPEFASNQDETFDRLFRAHLAAAWQALGRPVPVALTRPLLGGPPPLRDRPPTGPVAPDEVLGWWGAGCWDGCRPAGAMAVGVQPLDRVLWGGGDGAAHLRLVPRVPLPPVHDGWFSVGLVGTPPQDGVRVPYEALEGGTVDVCLPLPGPGPHRVLLRLWRGAELLGSAGPPEGLPVEIELRGAAWRSGWV